MGKKVRRKKVKEISHQEKERGKKKEKSTFCSGKIHITIKIFQNFTSNQSKFFDYKMLNRWHTIQCIFFSSPPTALSHLPIYGKYSNFYPCQKSSFTLNFHAFNECVNYNIHKIHICFRYM